MSDDSYTDPTKVSDDSYTDEGVRRLVQLEDGNTVWITGVFDQIQRPHKLVYTWAHEPLGEDTEHTRVTVRFEPRGKGTEVIVVHERFATRASRDRHAAGWEGCLDGLVRLLGAPQAL